jgi:hypothetical protein
MERDILRTLEKINPNTWLALAIVGAGIWGMMIGKALAVLT